MKRFLCILLTVSLIIGVFACALAEAEALSAEDMLAKGSQYEAGDGVEQDYARAASEFREAAKTGNQEGRNCLAYLYQNGLGVEKDEAKAFRMFKNAANSGSVNAMFQTAVCYENGIGCSMDLKKACDFYRRAAEQGDGASMDRLGLLYIRGGTGLKADPSMAFEWFLKGASVGMVDSMYSTGYMYSQGLGTSKNLREARKWLRMAADNGHEEAGRLLATLE